MAHIGAGNGVVGAGAQPAAQSLDGGFRTLDLAVTLHAFHGQKLSAWLHIGQAELGQHRKVGYGPGGGKVKGAPEGGIVGQLLAPGVNGGHGP